MKKDKEEFGPPDYESFKCLREDKYFVNNTRKDMLLIYPDGTMTIAMSRLKFHDNIVKSEDDEITIELDGSVIPSHVTNYVDSMNSAINTQLQEMTYGFPQLIERYYYGLEGQHKGEYREIPTMGHPVVIKSSVTFVLVLYDDQQSINTAIRDITSAGGAKRYANSLISDEFHMMGVGIRYINFSPFDLYYASHDNRQVQVLRHMRREEAIRYIQKSRDWTIIDNFSAELEEGNFIILGIIENGKLRLHKFEREENCTLASRSLQFADQSRYQEIIPIFYRRFDAEVFLEDYDANVSNIYLDAAAVASEHRIDEAVTQEVQVSKKNMTAVAKVCAAMVTTGLAYGIGRTIIEAILNKKKDDGKAAAIRLAAEKIIRKNAIGNMLRTSMIKKFGTSCLFKKAVGFGAMGTCGVTGAFASPMTVGLSSCASVLGVVAPIVIAGAVIATTIVLCVKHRDKIKEFIEDHPVVEKIVDGIKVVGAVALGLAVGAVVAVGCAVKKIWEGVKKVGSWFANLFGF